MLDQTLPLPISNVKAVATVPQEGRIGCRLTRIQTQHPAGKRTHLRLLSVLACACELASACPAAADQMADFYRGKNVNLMIGVNVGGSYDRDARLVARYLGSHMPGNPTIVPQNMIGGGGIVMANFLQTIAARDGTTIGMMPNTLVVNQLVGMAAVRYDMGQFHWIGSIMPAAHSAMAAWHASGIASIEDARRRQITAGASPKGSFLYAMPALLNEFLGTRFKIVAGYQGIASVYLALERGEVDSLGITWGEFKVEKSDMVRDRKVRILVQSAPKADDLPDVPTVDELAKDEADRGPMDFLLSGNALGRPLAAPPGTPAERVAALRAAFAETMKDPRFLRDVAASRTEFGPIAGDTLQHSVEQILSTPPQWIARAKVILE
jgi:tripartite-type tricarboxylate transporter receptor subunit TctC